MLRYVLGEMSFAEAQAFEEILATDQEAASLSPKAPASLQACWSFAGTTWPCPVLVMVARDGMGRSASRNGAAGRFTGPGIDSVARIVATTLEAGQLGD